MRHLAQLRRLKNSTQPTLVGVIVLSLVASACTKPGVRATGTAEVRWGGAEPTSWTGTCRYSVETRWSTSLPHILRLENADGEALVVQSSERLADGRSEVAGAGEGSIQGLAMDGATVSGSLHGTLDVSSSGDSTYIRISGVRTHRESVPFEARCWLSKTAV